MTAQIDLPLDLPREIGSPDDGSRAPCAVPGLREAGWNMPGLPRRHPHRSARRPAAGGKTMSPDVSPAESYALAVRLRDEYEEWLQSPAMFPAEALLDAMDDILDAHGLGLGGGGSER